MFLISLLVVSLILIAVANERSLTVEQEEFIPIPVKIEETKGSRKFR